ncbi:4-(cytidine 5'-diphospho)-2-C-methyl-D-erythritol kinase [Cohaesibacter celericrescens]|jgi:4-diphosphocytidyl-2-C-methyl-D-erythritol kinase|uniref:4-diphosphocytidyl-2-C-methyl-D-erythritol kinase n=1 Tax=Cohaesibacter celericrescens TaxID=2067669 RepID=A0A2N5XKT7_9HYPH|nr:4-(cytidine 5'-diphospho)-2-C-methyl-D-erythritol kinase [Cohaesibacter celericrescens]PLW75085.1 4-(cytidine 5'-diphospho)-2-C-methyl-D-erythritol kinase [Cohaesibacter celericrescens]
MSIQPPQDTALILEAPAKVNLALHITGQREDGYHFLDSLVVFGGASDRLIFKPSDHLHLSVTGPFAEGLRQEPDNLMVRAARSLAKELHLPAEAELTLEKYLPISAGIGGGSSDAATTLLGLLRLWERTIKDEKLRTIALQLGADVPMCLEGECLRASGIGGTLETGPRMPKNLGLVLINPHVPISTPDLFSKLKHKNNAPMGPMPSAFLSAAALAEWLSDQRNDLEMAAIEQAPVIETVLQALMDDGDCLFTRMSGSGATCFGLFNTVKHAEYAARRLTFSHPNWWVSHGAVR